MAESLALALRNATIEQPRAHLNGIPPSELEGLQKRMPDLIHVREEAAELARQMMKKSSKNDFIAMDLGGGALHPSILNHLLFPNLCTFSYFCHEYDVPDDLRMSCLWALQQKVIALEEAPDNQLQSLLVSPEGNIVPGAKRFMEGQTRAKLINYLLGYRINRPEEALTHVEACMKLEETANPYADPFSRNPRGYMLYGTILARTKTRNETAKTVLEKILKNMDKLGAREDSKTMSIQVKLYLSRVLRRLGELEEAKKHESYLVSWFKKNHQGIPEYILREWFETEDEPDPVLQGLGGASWLGKRKVTVKELDRQARRCFNCGKKDTPSQKLLRCAKCQYTYYCSRKCQVENYPYHKTGCAERAEDIKLAEVLKSIAPGDARCVEDWRSYKYSGFGTEASYHALGLRHDPNRGKTHILFKKMEYLPQGGKDVLDRFKVVSAGVFKLKDVYGEIEKYLGYNQGEGEQTIKEMLDEHSHRPEQEGRNYPFFNLFISDNSRVETFLSIGSVAPARLREIPYNPNWRKLLNRTTKYIVEPLSLPRSRAKDAERDYTTSDSQEEKKSGTVSPERNGSQNPDLGNTAAALPRLRGMFK